MSGRSLSRRELLEMLAAAPLVPLVPAGGVAGSDADALARATRHARSVRDGPGQSYEPLFFTPEEMRTVRVLAEMIIPPDDRSGGAGEAGVPEFIDFTVDDREALRIPVRGGLRWLDTESLDRFGAPFVEATEAQRREILDDIAWPGRAAPEHRHGVAFFNRFRDLVASGFFTSRMGMEDLRFMGNRPVREWTGCPDEAVGGLGVSYARWDARYGGDGGSGDAGRPAGPDDPAAGEPG